VWEQTLQGLRPLTGPIFSFPFLISDLRKFLSKVPGTALSSLIYHQNFILQNFFLFSLFVLFRVSGKFDDTPTFSKVGLFCPNSFFLCRGVKRCDSRQVVERLLGNVQRTQTKRNFKLTYNHNHTIAKPAIAYLLVALGLVTAKRQQGTRGRCTSGARHNALRCAQY